MKYSGLQELPTYRQLDSPSQLAVQLRDRRFTYQQIADQLFVGYGLERSAETVRNWFRPAEMGRLTAALEEWQQLMAREGLRTAVMALQRFTMPAVMVLGELMNHHDPKIRMMACIAILNKTVPDATPRYRRKRHVRGEPGVPAELMEAAYVDRHREPEERIAGEADWDKFLDAVRVQSSRVTNEQINRLQPV